MDNNFWYHGTYNAKELEQEGGFKNNTIIVDYTPNPNEFKQHRENLNQARIKGDEDEYFRLLDKTDQFKKKYSYHKPVFLTNVYAVAKTYADPKRAFDYQNATEKVLKVTVNCNKNVTINATNDRFRFINVNKVKQGFIKSGVSQQTIDELVQMFSYAVKNKEGIQTDTIAAIGNYLGFDCIDVIGVFDSYYGGNVKSTVRMVLKPELIKIVKPNLNENKQLAAKVYKDKLSDAEFNEILNITGGDNFTKAVADAYYLKKEEDWYIRISPENFYKQLKNYNKNVAPINFDINNITTEVLKQFEYRAVILKLLNELPSIAIRNLKSDIRLENDTLSGLKNSLEYLVGMLSQLNNRPEEVKQKFYKKIFASKHTLDDMINIVDDKEELLGGVEITKDSLKQIIDDNSELELIYHKPHAWVVLVEGPQAMKEIGCNSLWCFTYGKSFNDAFRNWSQYSHQDMVYVVVDWTQDSNSRDFMHVLIKPLDFENIEDEEANDEKLYSMDNDPQYDPLNALGYILKVDNNQLQDIFHFDYERHYELNEMKKLIKKLI